MTMVLHKIEYVRKDGVRVTEVHPCTEDASKASAQARKNGCVDNKVKRSRVFQNTEIKTVYLW